MPLSHTVVYVESQFLTAKQRLFLFCFVAGMPHCEKNSKTVQYYSSTEAYYNQIMKANTMTTNTQQQQKKHPRKKKKTRETAVHKNIGVKTSIMPAPVAVFFLVD